MARRRYSVQLRPSDLDVHGRVGNLQYLRFLEDARIQLLVDLGRPARLRETGQHVIRNEIDYDEPLELRTDAIRIDVWVAQMASGAYEVRYEVLDQAGTVYVRARTALICIDPDTGRMVDIDPALRSGLESCGGHDGVVDATRTATVGRLADRAAAPSA